MRKGLLQAGAVCLMLVFTIYGATITGKVTDQSNGNAIAGALIVLSLTEPVTAPVDTEITDNRGNYTFGGLSQGQYAAVTTESGYISNTSPARITGSNQTVTLDIALVPEGMALTGSIGGTVTSAATGKPVTGVVLILSSRSGTGPGSTTVALDTIPADQNGYYIFTDIAVASNYSIAASARGYEPAAKNQIAVVVNDTTITNFQLVPLPPATGAIYGTVRDSINKATIGDAEVILRIGTVSAGGRITWTTIDTAYSSATGTFLFDPLSPNTTQNPYSITVAAFNYQPYTSGNILVDSGAVDTVAVLLRQTPTSVVYTRTSAAEQPMRMTCNGHGGVVLRKGLQPAALFLYAVDGRAVRRR